MTFLKIFLKSFLRSFKAATVAVLLAIAGFSHADAVADAFDAIELSTEQSEHFNQVMGVFVRALKASKSDRRKLRDVLDGADEPMHDILTAGQWGPYLKYKQMIAAQALAP
ncbi:MAG: hypothetical protein O7H39_07585 [Gammaproteobacteria bacterium]|nr:hypothetical protein [Gammaproteobacteria bacterium]